MSRSFLPSQSRGIQILKGVGSAFFYWITGVLFDRALGIFSNVNFEVIVFIGVAIGTGIVGSLLLYDMIRGHPYVKATVSETERINFRSVIFKEVEHISDELRATPDTANVSLSKITYSWWKSKTEEEKVELIGIKPYHMLQSIYDKIDTRNTFLENALKERKGLDFSTIRNLGNDCLDSIKKASQEIDWLKDIVSRVAYLV